MSQIDLYPIVRQAWELAEARRQSHRRSISASKLQVPLQASCIAVNPSVDGGFVFTGDREFTAYLDPLDLAAALQKWDRSSNARQSESSVGSSYFSLSVPTHDSSLKGQTLCLDFLPLTIGMESQANFKTPTKKSNKEKAAIIRKGLEDKDGLAVFLDKRPYELAESSRSSREPHTQEFFARFQVPVQRFADLFSGEKNREERGTALVGLCPGHLDACVEALLADSRYLDLVVQVARKNGLGRFFKDRFPQYLNDLTEDTESMIETARWAAARAAFAGPYDMASGPPNAANGWIGLPVARLAAWYFMQFLRNHNRRSKYAEKEEQQSIAAHEKQSTPLGLERFEPGVGLETRTADDWKHLAEDLVWAELRNKEQGLRGDGLNLEKLAASLNTSEEKSTVHLALSIAKTLHSEAQGSDFRKKIESVLSGPMEDLAHHHAEEEVRILVAEILTEMRASPMKE